MLFYRSKIKPLKAWSERPHRKPLILRGARQVGKTTLVNELASEYPQFISLNLEKKNDLQLFVDHENVEDILDILLLERGFKSYEK